MSDNSPPKTVLHVGCGRGVLPAHFVPAEWREIRLDLDPSVKPDIVAGLTDMSQISDATIDAVWSSHSLEHLYAHEVPLALREFFRVLKDGGLVYIITPDAQIVAQEIARGNLEGQLYRSPSGPISPIDVVCGHRAQIEGGNPFMAHKTGFTAQTLERRLEAAGFGAIRVKRRLNAYELRATAQKPTLAQPLEALLEHGARLRTAQRWEEAEALYRQVVARQNAHWRAWYELGTVCYMQGKLDDAIASMKKVVAAQPTLASANRALGAFLGAAGQSRSAIKYLQESLKAEPNSIDARYNLGRAWRDQGAFTRAKEEFQNILRIQPDNVAAHIGLGDMFSQRGETEKAFECYRTALKLDSKSSWVHSNVAMILNFLPNYSSAEVFAEHRRFDEQRIAPLRSTIREFLSERDPDRRLRIGYVSRDLRTHSVSYFMNPIMALHDHVRHEVVCYYTNQKHDDLTAQFQKYVDKWIECPRLADEALAEKIREDQIDILVDLGGHTRENRLLLFGRKPAPIQITYLGYPSTTGLSSIDYRITDRYIDPEPADPEIFSSERPLRLECGYFCYQPRPDSPDINELPALRNGYVTFGSLNQQAKLNPELLSWWAEILRQIPNARLIIQNRAARLPDVQQQFKDQFMSLGIESSRISFRKYGKPPEYLKTYHEIDIGLDTFPYNGGTTTCEALWMGAPVISMEGKRQVSRLGLSILSHLDLAELVSASPSDYVATAVRLARDLSRLKNLRQDMRARMSTSPLMNAEGFVRELEAAYRTVWQRWCAAADDREIDGSLLE